MHSEPFCCFSHTIEGDLRLVGSYSDNRGRVEVYHNAEWGTVCDDGWGLTDAHVVCRQLGYSGAISAYRHAFFGRGSGPIHYNDVACTGSESRLADCSHRRNVHDCYHSEDAGVVCDTTQGKLKLFLIKLNSCLYLQQLCIHSPIGSSPACGSPLVGHHFQ